jgi:2-keto-3-deoxy-L-arabinonate dehydratase
MAPTKTLAGIYPIAPVPFQPNGDLDLDCMIDQGVDGICILANFSEQFLLTDAEREKLLDLSLSHVAGRVPVIVTCSHFSTRIASERGRRAAKTGARGAAGDLRPLNPVALGGASRQELGAQRARLNGHG